MDQINYNLEVSLDKLYKITEEMITKHMNDELVTNRKSIKNLYYIYDEYNSRYMKRNKKRRENGASSGVRLEKLKKDHKKLMCIYKWLKVLKREVKDDKGYSSDQIKNTPFKNRKKV